MLLFHNKSGNRTSWTRINKFYRMVFMKDHLEHTLDLIIVWLTFKCWPTPLAVHSTLSLKGLYTPWLPYLKRMHIKNCNGYSCSSGLTKFSFFSPQQDLLYTLNSWRAKNFGVSFRPSVWSPKMIIYFQLSQQPKEEAWIGINGKGSIKKSP